MLSTQNTKFGFKFQIRGEKREFVVEGQLNQLWKELADEMNNLLTRVKRLSDGMLLKQMLS